MISPLVTFAAIPAQADLTIDGGDFSSTSATVAAVSPRGRAFLAEIFGGAGAIDSVVMPKSKALEFAAFAADRGVRS